jgi:hypothetical protein
MRMNWSSYTIRQRRTNNQNQVIGLYKGNNGEIMDNRFEATKSNRGPTSWIVIDTQRDNRTVSRYLVDPSYFTEEGAEEKAHETAKHMNGGRNA